MSIQPGLKRARAWPWALTFVLACVTPTLPPDDPPEPEVVMGVGVARLSGHIGEPGPAFVLVHNRVSGLVFGQRTLTGAYDFEVPTEPCDPLQLWYTASGFQSTAISFQPAELAGRRGECSSGAATPSPNDAGLERE